MIAQSPERVKLNKAMKRIALLVTVFVLVVITLALLTSQLQKWVRSLEESADSRIHPFQQTRDSAHPPRLGNLLNYLNNQRRVWAPRDTEMQTKPSWFAYAHFEQIALPDLSRPPTVSDVSVRRIVLSWAPLIFLDAAPHVYQLSVSGYSSTHPAPPTATVRFADGQTRQVEMSPFEKWSSRQSSADDKGMYWYSDFWRGGKFADPSAWRGSVRHIDWHNFDWILFWRAEEPTQAIEWLLPVDLRDVVYYEVGLDERGQVRAATIGVLRRSDGVAELELVVEGRRQRVKFRTGERWARWGYRAVVWDGADLIEKVYRR
jgi:hypothetical protein